MKEEYDGPDQDPNWGCLWLFCLVVFGWPMLWAFGKHFLGWR